MENRNHEWIQKFNHYEAVLLCTHELGAWDRDQTLRAYQTFGFDDATTNGNDLSFGHIDTGVMVLHDGDVVAIQYGGGEMVKALADLFTTLNALGWKKAEVYHPQETMDALLTDMGKAIPGHLDFDVHPAREVASSAEDSHEASQMMELGMNLMAGVASNTSEAQEFNRGALAELQSMAQEEHLQLEQHAPVPLDIPLALDDGLEAYSAPVPTSSPPERVVFADDEDSVPIVPILDRQPVAVDQALPVSAPIFVEEDEQQPTPTVHSSPATAPQIVDPLQAVDKQAAIHVEPQQQIIPSQKAAPNLPAATGMQSQADTSLPSTNSATAKFLVMKLGRSGICFDLPEAPLEQSSITDAAQEMHVSEFVHIWPGLTNQSERWDLLAEIDPTAPWSAEIIADELNFSNPGGRLFFAAALQKAAAEKMQIRDLLIALFDGSYVPDFWASASQGIVDIKCLAQEVFCKLGALMLSDVGESFLDTKPAGATDDNNSPSTYTILSARSISQDPAAKLYVVHLDACDGPFVRTIVTLMSAVAQRYSVSSRNVKKAEAQKAQAIAEEERIREMKRKEAMERTMELLNSLSSHLKDTGLDASQIQTMLTS